MKARLTNIIISLLVLLFSYTAFSKFLLLNSFRMVLAQVFNEKGADVIVLLIPISETFTVLLLLFSKARLIGLYASFIILTAFTVYLLYMLLFVPHLPCSCGGVIGKMSWRWHVVFNGAFIGLTMLGIRNLRREK